MKKIGNQGFMLFVFSILFSFSSILFCSDKNIRLYIQDMEQNPIRQAERGVPFLLQVVVDNMNGVLAPENVPGFEQFQVTRYGSSQSTNIINGQRTDRMIFNYSLRADATGTFRLGPLSLKDKNGAMITSQSIQVVVGDQTIAHSIKKQPYFLDTQIDKKSLYVGQELILKIKFYYAAEFENLKIVQPKFEHFVVGQTTSEPVTGIETIRGADYHYQEWQLQVYPEKIGLLTIPPVQAVYHVASDFSHGFMGMFDMFGMTSEKTVQSHARSVDVMPLPESKMYKNITAIGQFDSATLVLKQNKGEIGEGIVATCTVSGDGNFTMMKHPPLKLPEGLKYYESNSSVQKLAAGKQEKTFEYIIQAEQPGDFKIPFQEFFYFDPVVQQYKKLQTNEAALKIVGDVIVAEKTDVAKAKDVVDSKNKSSNYVFKEGQIDYVLDSGLQIAHENIFAQKMLSWLLFLLGLLTCFAILYGLYNSYVSVSWYEIFWIYYMYVLIRLWHIKRTQNVTKLYGLFEQVCNHYHVEIQSLEIIEAFQKLKFSNEKIDEWKKFVQILLIVIFSQSQDTIKDKKNLFDKGQFWMKELLNALQNAARNQKK